MATKKSGKKSAPAKSDKKKAGRPKSANADEKIGKKPVVIFLEPKLHARTRLACMALSTSVSKVVRDLLAHWVVDQKKAIASVVNMESDEDENEEVEEEEEEETEEEETEEEEEEEEDEDEEEEED